ncbi:hypothetical protein ACWDSJ_22850 [Nocardia sp. NPDC003482]
MSGPPHHFPGTRSLADAADRDIDAIRPLRDEIEQRVLTGLGLSSPA